jgi:hypothetical protein
MRIKIFFVLFIVILSASLSFSISKKSYYNLTDRDRILLSISYYEVAMKFKDIGKNDLYESYLSESYKIEKNVKKYISGELAIPEKTISINIDSIISDTTDDNIENNINNNNNENSDNTNDNQSYLNNNPDKIIITIVKNIIDKNFNDAISYFNDEIWLTQYNYSLNSDQLLEIFKEWKLSNENIKNTEEVINSISSNVENYDFNNFTLDNNNYELLQINFKISPIFPGNEGKNYFVLIFEKFDNPLCYRIVCIDQI